MASRGGSLSLRVAPGLEQDVPDDVENVVRGVSLESKDSKRGEDGGGTAGGTKKGEAYQVWMKNWGT